MKDIENFDPQNLQIVIDQEPISKIKHIRCLGIEVDQILSWEEHISALIEKISRGIGMLRHGKRYLPLTTVESIGRFRSSTSTITSFQLRNRSTHVEREPPSKLVLVAAVQYDFRCKSRTEQNEFGIDYIGQNICAIHKQLPR